MFIRMILLAAIPLLAIYLFKKLQHIRFKQYAHLPQLKPSLIWGHLQAFNNFIIRGERKRHADAVFMEMKEHLGNPPLFVVDCWPVQTPLCIICNHEVAEQVAKGTKSLSYGVPKSQTMSTFKPLFGATSILTAEGEEWKSLRKRFNPGFAPQHLISLLPCILDKAWPFLEFLDGYARSGEEFALDDLCINLTFDIIGAVTMDVDLGAQLDKDHKSEIVKLYRQLMTSYNRETTTRWIWIDPTLVLRRWRISRQLDRLIKDRIKQKFAELKEDDSPAKSNKNRKSRSVLSLSLRDIDRLDNRILDQTSDQLKTFLFAGHDTTSILLQWAFYELSRTPRALTAIRHELNDIFGPNSSPSVVRDMLLSNGEELISRMSYTSAVIKETLRLYPPSGTARYSPPGSGWYVQLPGGSSACLDGLVVYNCETIIQRDEAVYGPTKDEFRPERWLGDTDTSMKTNEITESEPATGRTPATAWRPFERGPRNCIGQELANIEARVILACSVRRYDFVKVGLGEVVRDAAGEPILNSNGQYKVNSPLFNTMQVTGKPVDGTRVKVKFVSGAESVL